MKRFDFSSKNLQNLGNLKVLRIKETNVLDALLGCCSQESQAFYWRGSQMRANVKLSPTDLCVNCYSAKRLFQKKKRNQETGITFTSGKNCPQMSDGHM